MSQTSCEVACSSQLGTSVCIRCQPTSSRLTLPGGEGKGRGARVGRRHTLPAVHPQQRQALQLAGRDRTVME